MLSSSQKRQINYQELLEKKKKQMENILILLRKAMAHLDAENYVQFQSYNCKNAVLEFEKVKRRATRMTKAANSFCTETET